VNPSHRGEGMMTGAGAAPRFSGKQEARQAVWDSLVEQGQARFPFPPHHRIPNFAGAREAADQLLGLPEFQAARCIKVNPDAPQRPVRLGALRRGIVVYVPAPRLRGGFKRFDPARIPDDQLAAAASLSRGGRWAEKVPLADLPEMDLIVTGSVAVTRDGRRCGKGTATPTSSTRSCATSDTLRRLS
ncbi:MAG: 5-formyltetrahydrofolate cyclo-ligase, partial [Acidobacteriota bacterium]